MTVGDEPEAVLDASALIALLWEEQGTDVVEPLMGRAVISAVNMSEVLQRYHAVGLDAVGRQAGIQSLGIGVEGFHGEDADAVAGFWAATRREGLSLADRACLALSHRLGLPAYTADGAWREVDIGVEVVVIR